MNFPSDEQLMAVGQSCSFFRNKGLEYDSEHENDISCEECKHWIDERCTINVFDDILTSIDQT